MKILVVGSGGREHALIKSLKKNPQVDTIYALPGNGGIAQDAVCVNIGAKEIGEIVDFAVLKDIDFAVVALGRGGRPGGGGHSRLRAHEGCRPDREQQGVCQGADAKVRHSHGEIPCVH